MQDVDRLLDAALDLRLLSCGIDRAQFGGQREGLLQDYAQLPLREWSLAEASLRITRMGSGQQVRMPRNLLVLMCTWFRVLGARRAGAPEPRASVAKASRYVRVRPQN